MHKLRLNLHTLSSVLPLSSSLFSFFSQSLELKYQRHTSEVFFFFFLNVHSQEEKNEQLIFFPYPYPAKQNKTGSSLRPVQSRRLLINSAVLQKRPRSEPNLPEAIYLLI